MKIDTVYGVKIEKIYDLIKCGQEIGFSDSYKFIDYIIKCCENFKSPYESCFNTKAIKEIDAKYAEKKDYSFEDEKNDGAAMQ